MGRLFREDGAAPLLCEQGNRGMLVRSSSQILDFRRTRAELRTAAEARGGAHKTTTPMKSSKLQRGLLPMEVSVHLRHRYLGAQIQARVLLYEGLLPVRPRRPRREACPPPACRPDACPSWSGCKMPPGVFLSPRSRYARMDSGSYPSIALLFRKLKVGTPIRVANLAWLNCGDSAEVAGAQGPQHPAGAWPPLSSSLASPDTPSGQSTRIDQARTTFQMEAAVLPQPSATFKKAPNHVQGT